MAEDTNTANDAESPRWVSIEIQNGFQRGPVKIISQFGTRLDYDDDGKMKFFVDGVDAEGSRIVLFESLSYEDAIEEAERAGTDFGVPVNDRVAP